MTELPAFTPFVEQRSAEISGCGKYRYRFTRRWALEGKTLLFVMLNPSTADAMADDATTLKCARFAKILGFTAIEIVNLYAYRATDPRDLAAAGFPLGPYNDAYILEAARDVVAAGGQVCVAWGAGLGDLERGRQVLRLLDGARATPMALHVTKDGHPGHPLYLSSMCKLKPFEYAEYA